MGEDDWNLDAHQWQLMSRCNSAARLLFPYNARQKESWSLMAYRKWSAEGVPPEVLRDQRCPGIKELHSRRPPNYSLLS